MMLTKRDKAIISDLNKFRCMDRDTIADIHFDGIKNPTTAANSVLLRLLRDGQICRSVYFQPYVYFGADSQIKKNSQKINHFLAILNVYKEMIKLGRLETFLVEPKYGSKGLVEPDAYAKFRNTGFFVECQRTMYSEKQMADKLGRYVNFYNSGVMASPFPHLLIITDQRYLIDGEYPFKIFQAKSFTQFNESLKSPQPVKTIESGGGIKVKIG